MATLVITPAYEPGEYVVAMMHVFVLKHWADENGLEVEYMKRMKAEGEIRLKLKTTSPLPDHVLNTSWINGVPVTVRAPPSLNRMKGFIYHPELKHIPIEVLEQELAEQGVVKVNKDRLAEYATLFFDRSRTTQLPDAIILGWDRVRVKPPKPQPRRCYNCQAYGHVAAECRDYPVCARCAQKHDEEERQCRRPIRCAACGGPHTVYDRSCKAWAEECVVAQIRNNEKISYKEAVIRRQNIVQEDRRQREQEERSRQEQQEQEQDDDTDTDEYSTDDVSVEDEEETTRPPQTTSQRKTATTPTTEWQTVSKKRKTKHMQT